MKEVVVSFFDKDLNWLDGIDKDVKITVYQKGGNPCSLNTHKLHNVGRCVHTFFNHIKENYDLLSDYTFFCQDYPFDHVSNMVEIINGFDPDTFDLSPFKKPGYWALLDDPRYDSILTCDWSGSPHHAGLDLKSVWDSLFSSGIPETISFVPAGHFCVSADSARMRSLEFYENLVYILETRENAPWEIERLEQYIFNPDINEKDLVRSLQV
jgi:hypothetical protein